MTLKSAENEASPLADQGSVSAEEIALPEKYPDKVAIESHVSDQTPTESSIPQKTFMQGGMLLASNKKVEKWIRYFTTTDRERFQRFLNRGERYREVVENVLRENDLPPELYYLAMIESGYRTDARSLAKASGVWQFMAGTAKNYGLRVDAVVDERRDPIRATEAAAKYLRDLYNVFGSWHLAMAAYNAGEIRILRAIIKGRTRDFWQLTEARVLPRETAEYVPKFLAVVALGTDPQKYGFILDKAPEIYPELESIRIPEYISVQDLAQRLNLAPRSLSRINPQLLSSRSPRGGCEIWVPESLAERAQQVAGTMKPDRSRPHEITHRRAIASEKRDPKIHVVKSGETLGRIAVMYKVSIGHLKRMNSLRSSHIEVGMRLRTQVKKYEAAKFISYKVQRGENLNLIAQRFRTTVKKLKSVNELLGSKIFNGQVLRVPSARGR